MKSLKNYGPLIILVLLIDTNAELIGMQVFKIGRNCQIFCVNSSFS